MQPMEKRLLQSADCVVVQTEKDRQWVSQITNGRLAHATHVVSNGINPELLLAPAPTVTATFGHAGSLSLPSNARTVRWLLNQVLPAVHRTCPTATLSVLGSPGPADLMDRLTRHVAVRYVPRVEKMQEFFATVPILIVRNYKDIGLITRTIEAMGAGVVVIGEPGAFNGIRRFRDGVHGFVAERTCDVADVLVRLFSDSALIAEVSQAARALIREDFRREDRFDFVQKLLEGMACSNPSASRAHAA
ncbi:MAG: glycosyltransferase [Patescibacteria group bacterium]|nr:glycosyltransferase [Patescibacteria group bacterium]